MSTSTTVDFAQYADNIMELRYSHVVQGCKESWHDIANRVTCEVLFGNSLPVDINQAIFEAIRDRKFIPGGRILSQAGRGYHQTDNCFCLRAKNTREGWADLAHKTTMMFMSGGGVGCDYSEISAYGTPLVRSGGIASGPVPLITMVDGIAKAARQGGERRGANYASLRWDHPDIQQFIAMKTDGQSLKHTNISVRFDNNWIAAQKNQKYEDFRDIYASSTFYETLRHACQYGDPGFQFDNDDQILRNACGETIAAEDSDSCCIGSLNLARIESLQELKEITELATLFLMCNTLYTDCPTEKVRDIKQKNRRVVLGLMGVAEWFVQRQQPYGQIIGSTQKTNGVTNCISEWLQCYKDASNEAALHWSNKLNIALPIAVRGIAPTGTISALGYTTPGIEPIFHTAYQRTYNTLKTQHNRDGYVKEKIIDPVVLKWLQEGYDVRDIDTAYTLSQSVEGIERRLAFQAFAQQYVDNGISSTVNLPAYREGIAEAIAPVLLKYLPKLRGVTFYPDGRYDNQPVVPLNITEVLAEKEMVTESYESCKIGECGS